MPILTENFTEKTAEEKLAMVDMLADKLVNTLNAINGNISLGNRNIKAMSQEEKRTRFRYMIQRKWQTKYPNA
jgi:hypothetical protein